MKQLIQNIRTGETKLEDVPAPCVRPGQVLIQTRRSLVSLGTERMLVEFGKASLLTKVRQQPDKVKQVLEKLRSDGVMPTLKAIHRKLDQPIPLGYCHVGTVLAVGEGVTDLRVGDRVASNGHHAELVCVVRNLVARIPDEVSDDEAAFTVVGAIGLHSIHLLAPTLGETVVVIGLGLIGLLTAQLLRINGCRVIGIEPNEARCQLAAQWDIRTVNSLTEADAVRAVMALTDGVGADGVLITASSQTDKLLAQATRMSRQKGKVILVGTTDMTMSRADMYEKELTLQVSCAYGPGRYDDAYEQRGHDYPLAHVRWTVNRNFQAVLQLLATGQLVVSPLITERIHLANYQKIYNDLASSERIAALLTYPKQVEVGSVLRMHEPTYDPRPGTIGIIGAGNFTRAILLPALQKASGRIKTIASRNGLEATLLARKFGVQHSTSDYRHILADTAIDLCVITTRHDSHTRLTMEALRAGKHVFVEKPLAIHAHELHPLIECQQQSGRMVMVGFNRRFSPYAQKMKALLGGERASDLPMTVVVTVNAGFIPATEWLHDRSIGGGRLLGEACHFVDLITFLTGSRVSHVCMNAMGRQPTETSDSASLLLRYENGSIGTINYLSNGSKAYSKERVEVYSQGRTLVLKNFRTLAGYGFKGFYRQWRWQNKGHVEQMKLVLRAVQAGKRFGNESNRLIPFEEIINTTQTMLAALQSLHEGRFVNVSSIGMTSEKLVPEGDNA